MRRQNQCIYSPKKQGLEFEYQSYNGKCQWKYFKFETENDIETENGLVTIPNDWVLALTGYQPDLSFLEKAGIQLSEDEIKNPSYNEETHETNVPNIFLAGVICGGMNTHRLFIENSREHAVKIMEVIKTRKSTERLDAV